MSTISTPELIAAYTYGFFPMAHPEEGNAIYWHKPHLRGIIPLDHFHIPKNLMRLLRKGDFEFSINQCFSEVLEACAQRDETWISDEIKELYLELHEMQLGHSFEVWYNGELAGGLYGVSLKSAFFGESMFHRKSEASKLALCYLVHVLKTNGFTLLDTQFITDHLRQFGAIEISSGAYEELLNGAMLQEATPIQALSRISIF